jgi:hypothetical protein
VTRDEARAVGFVLNWAQGRSLPSDGIATRAARVLTAGARGAGEREHSAIVRLSSTATVRERLIQLRGGVTPLTDDERAAIGVVLDVLDKIERKTL